MPEKPSSSSPETGGRMSDLQIIVDEFKAGDFYVHEKKGAGYNLMNEEELRAIDIHVLKQRISDGEIKISTTSGVVPKSLAVIMMSTRRILNPKTSSDDKQSSTGDTSNLQRASESYESHA